MAITRVNTTTINAVFNTNPLIITIPATGTGNLIVLLLNHEAASNTNTIYTTSVTDNAGNVYQAVPNTLQLDNTTQGSSTEVWYAANSISGATIVTITCNMTIDIDHSIIVEYSGVALISPILDGQHAESTGTASLGPVLTTSDPNALLVTLIYKALHNVSGVTTPWDALPYADSNFVELIAPGTTGTYQAVFTPPQTDLYLTSGAVFSSISSPSPLILNLSDSVSLVDSLSPSFNLSQNLSDSISVSDSAPQAFSVQSDFLVPVGIPTVEMLVNQLVPAHVKTYFRIQE